MENNAVPPSDIFTEAGKTMSGMMSMTGDFFSNLWSNPMGKIIITLGIVSAAVGLCYKLFLRRKHI